MIPELLLALVPVGLILLISEYLWRKKIVKGERARKFIHILAGSWIAFWPLYIPFDGIVILGAVAVALLVYSRITKLFHAIYAVKRRTYGDIFFAVSIVFCAYFGEAEWIFTISILLMALADGGAAVIGRFWGINNQYFVLGFSALRKSISGTLAFVMLAYVSLLIGWLLGGKDVMGGNLVAVVVTLPLTATVLENFSPFGFDNLLTPLFATLLLNSLL